MQKGPLQKTAVKENEQFGPKVGSSLVFGAQDESVDQRTNEGRLSNEKGGLQARLYQPKPAS